MWQNLPVFALALFLLIGLGLWPDRMVKGFCLLSEGIRWLVTVGLVLAAVESMAGWNPVSGMAPLENSMATVSSIGVVLLGIRLVGSQAGYEAPKPDRHAP